MLRYHLISWFTYSPLPRTLKTQLALVRWHRSLGWTIYKTIQFHLFLSCDRKRQQKEHKNTCIIKNKAQTISSKKQAANAIWNNYTCWNESKHPARQMKENHSLFLKHKNFCRPSLFILRSPDDKRNIWMDDHEDQWTEGTKTRFSGQSLACQSHQAYPSLRVICDFYHRHITQRAK